MSNYMRPNYVGRQIGNYRLIKLLGHGEFAEVYLGDHVHLRLQVAVKVLTNRLTDQEVVNFRKETLAITGLEHPNILRVYDFGIVDHTPCVVMAYAPNGSLRTFHPGETRLDRYAIAFYVKQVAAALHYAQDKKVIHRDIKPANMLLGPGNEVLLGDFGMAHIYQNYQGYQSTPQQNTWEVTGTAPYMAPEQFQGTSHPATDQYALGVVVYEWLCGDRPFHGTFTELYSQHMFVPPPPLREKVPGISQCIEAVVMTALAKNPQQRFASVLDFANALEQACKSEPSLRSNPTLVFPNRPTLPSRPLFSEPNSPSLMPAPLVESATMPMPDVPRATAPLQRETQPERRLPRRAVLAGMAGVAGLAVVGGGIGFLTLFRKSPIGTNIYTYRGHANDVYDAEWSPDGKRISSASNDHTVRVWDAPTGNNGLIYAGNSEGLRVAPWSADGKRIASGGYDRTVQVWDATTVQTLLTYNGHSDTVWRVAWSPDEQRIASASQDGTVQVWEATNGRRVFTYTGHGRYPVRAVVWSPDGKRIASGGYDHTVQVWDATTGNKDFTYYGHKNWVTTVAWSADGKRIVSGGYDHTVQVWDATSGAHIYTYPGHAVNTRNMVQNVNIVAWSPDGQRIASGAGDRTVQVWDATTGANAFTYHGHTGLVYSVAWSPDGQLVASASTDRTVQVWQAV
jgi:serine/threonine protein kinase/Tol biopolymer transport system component